jgi:hypothetical protein
MESSRFVLRVLGWTIVAACSPAAAHAAPIASTPFTAQRAGEAVLTLDAACPRCSWSMPGREAVALRILLDGAYSQHVLVTGRGRDEATRVLLGAVAAGPHAVSIELDHALGAPDAGSVEIASMHVSLVTPDDAAFEALSHAPILYARADTIGRFTDAPVLMWSEATPTPRGHEYRYSVVFTNEDGGTPTDRLMATWGRTTDIEFIYGVELHGAADVAREAIQAEGHVIQPFAGQHEDRHPLLWVATPNNMVADHGTTRVRYRPAPEPLTLDGVSREVIMDRHPWTYALMAAELVREGKVADDAAPGSGRIPDPRSFLFLEACSTVEHAALAYSIGTRGSDDRVEWLDGDRGLQDFRIVRSGCFRGAVPAPHGKDVVAVRFKMIPVPEDQPRNGSPSDAGASAAAGRVTRINQVFTLDDRYRPQPLGCSWVGALDLARNDAWTIVQCR